MDLVTWNALQSVTGSRDKPHDNPRSFPVDVVMANAGAQNDAATDYWPIHIARSDGQGYPNLDHSALNPSEDQDVTQQERWEVIVAGHLQNQVGPKDDSKSLATFATSKTRC